MAAKTDESDVENMKEQLEALRRDFAQLANDLKGLGGTAADAARRKAAANGAKLRDDIEGMFDDLVDRGSHVLDDATAKIEQRPIASVLVALLIGFVIGRLLDRR